MSESLNKNRVIFLDLLRAAAILLLLFTVNIEHTLGDEFRKGGTTLLQAWVYLNSVTIPFFIFTSGTLFMYLYKTQNLPFRENEMVTRGLKRGITLLAIGYALQLPWYRWISSGGESVPAAWDSFVVVDILQILGICMLLMVLLMYISDRSRLKNYQLFALAAIVLLASGMIFEHSGIAEKLPPALQAWFTQVGGSKYPLFHFGFYFLAGNCAGCYIYNHPEAFESVNNARMLLLSGVLLIALSFAGELIISAIGTYDRIADKVVIKVFRKTGLIILGLIAVIHTAIILKENPKIFILLSRNTLLLYVVNIILIERTPLREYFLKIYGPVESVVMAAGMTAFMVLFVIIYNKLHFKNFSMMRGG